MNKLQLIAKYNSINEVGRKKMIHLFEITRINTFFSYFYYQL